MKINFNHIMEQDHAEFKSGKGITKLRMFQDDLGKIMKGCLQPHSSIGYHKHETNSEIIFILDGNGRVLYDDTEETLTAGDCHYCPKGHAHSLINDSEQPLSFFAVVPEQ